MKETVKQKEITMDKFDTWVRRTSEILLGISTTCFVAFTSLATSPEITTEQEITYYRYAFASWFVGVATGVTRLQFSIQDLLFPNWNAS